MGCGQLEGGAGRASKALRQAPCTFCGVQWAGRRQQPIHPQPPHGLRRSTRHLGHVCLAAALSHMLGDMPCCHHHLLNSVWNCLLLSILIVLPVSHHLLYVPWWACNTLCPGGRLIHPSVQLGLICLVCLHNEGQPLCSFAGLYH